MRLRNQTSIYIQPRRPAKECNLRLIVPNLRLQQVPVHLRNVRRIRNNRIELLTGNRAQQIGLEKSHALSDTMRIRIPPSNGKSSLRDIERRHLRLRQRMRQSYSNRSGTRAYVSDPQLAIMRHPSKQSLDQVLGLRPRNQNIGSNSKRKPEKLLLAKNVLDGLMRTTSTQPTGILLRLLRS